MDHRQLALQAIEESSNSALEDNWPIVRAHNAIAHAILATNPTVRIKDRDQVESDMIMVHFKNLNTIGATRAGKLLQDYIEEADDTEWEGYTNEELAVIDKFLADMIRSGL